MHDTATNSPGHVAGQSSLLAPGDTFPRRHLGSTESEVVAMLGELEMGSFDELIAAAVPEQIRLSAPLNLPKDRSEHSTLVELKAIAAKNRIFKNYLGQGYSDCIVPPVIQRNILENPGWYTAYTPYQAEISKGRMEALINFQQFVIDLTGLDIANASLLDEATAAAEAMHIAHAMSKDAAAKAIFVSERCHPQTIAVVQTRAEPLGITVIVGDEAEFDFAEKVFAVLLQYPDTTGVVLDYAPFIEQAHAGGALAIVAADILALTLLRPPGEFGADIAIGSTQRFGVPLGFGGPHAAFMAVKDACKRLMPGRLVGVSKDVHGQPAYRLSLQTREQHIRRDKATSNICTAQVLLAVMASMYAVYHGPEGLKEIARRVHLLAATFAEALERLGFRVSSSFFDTVLVELGSVAARQKVLALAQDYQINLRLHGPSALLLAFDETTTEEDLQVLVDLFSDANAAAIAVGEVAASLDASFAPPHARTSPFLSHPVFNKHHTEHEMLRYIRRLEAKDLSLTTSMIPLGSCTMKLNGTSEMVPVTWAEFGQIHPFAPVEQTQGYQILFQQLETWLAEITGFAGISLQPNAGSQGEYTGLLVIRQYHQQRGQGHRNVCLIPQSAHGTNPASAVMAGMQVVPVACDNDGNIDIADLKSKAEKHQDHLAALMVTYPSTHGVFEEGIQEICTIVHHHGGQVYLDGANLNAQVGLCRPGDFGADVCHLNLHKTFCIPHGGGGPGMGPIGVAAHLVPFLPGHSVISPNSQTASSIGAVSAAPWGSSSILPISWMYIALMGGAGLTKATEVAILSANYIAKRLETHYPVLYKGKNGLVAHECILDLRQFKKTAEIEVDDIAKRLIDYGFHPPTVSWPVAGTVMVEPTESESKTELDRFCDAMIAIREEIREIEAGGDRHNNLLKNAPHTAADLTADEWSRPYSRQRAAYPTPWTREHKFWAAVGRIDNAYGDRNLVCSCLPMEAYEP